MDVNLKNYKQFLCDILLSSEDDSLKNSMSFAKTVSASVPMYLGRQVDLNNESEKEIYLYVRELINNILTKKVSCHQLSTQIRDEIGIDEPIEKEEIDIVRPTPLMNAIIKGNYREFKRLIETGVDVNERNGDGQFYPLNIAMQFRRYPAIYVDALLKAGADIRQSNKTGCELLMTAKDNLDVQVVELLKKAGVNINAQDESNNGDTALICLMMFQYYRSAKALIQSGADVNISNQYGYTPLYWAIGSQNYPMMEMLIDAGADLDKHIIALNVTHRKLGFLRSKENKASRKKWIALMKKIKRKKDSSEKTNNKFMSFFKSIFSGGRS